MEHKVHVVLYDDSSEVDLPTEHMDTVTRVKCLHDLFRLVSTDGTPKPPY